MLLLTPNLGKLKLSKLIFWSRIHVILKHVILSCYSENSYFLLNNPTTLVQISSGVLVQDCNENIYVIRKNIFGWDDGVKKTQHQSVINPIKKHVKINEEKIQLTVESLWECLVVLVFLSFLFHSLLVSL